MAEEDDSQKTEEPTPKKLEKAREKGQVAQSQELKSWAILMGGTLCLLILAPGIMRGVKTTGRQFLELPHAMALDPKNLQLLFSEVMIQLFIYVGPLLGILLVIALLAGFGQTGLLFAPSKLKPELSKISLKKGFKNKFSMRQLVEFIKGIVKLTLVAAVALAFAVPYLGQIALAPTTDLMFSMERVHEIGLWIFGGTVAVMTVIAALDYAYQKYNHIKQLKMTRQEVKDEHKQSEGDPHVKAQIRRIRTERARRRMMAAVPQADVVVTNPTHYAVALEYKMDQMAAPRVVAKGVDSLAFRIRSLAEENDVPIVENPPLARALYASVELDEEIPSEHFKAVAEVIGYVMRLRGDLPPSANP